MRVNANAKINLALDVLGKMDNGYHKVSMIMQEVSLCDNLDITPNESKDIFLSVKNFCLPTDSSNIAYRAAESFYNCTQIDGGCDIVIEKHIPICAGLGGGSSDAAAVLKALNEIYAYPLDNEKLLELSLSLGADVPFFIKGKTAHATGIGEILTPIKSKLDYWVVLIKPDIDISTADAYKAIDNTQFTHPDVQRVITGVVNGNINDLILYSGNAFEYVSRPLYSEIDLIKNHLVHYGAEFAMMSGSGPTVFGLFKDKSTAISAFEAYKHSLDGGGVCKMII